MLDLLGDMIETLGLPVFIVVAAFVAWFALSLVLVFTTDADCLRLGYAAAKISWSFDRYCVARVDQSDVVVPLVVARQNPRQPK